MDSRSNASVLATLSPGTSQYLGLASKTNSTPRSCTRFANPPSNLTFLAWGTIPRYTRSAANAVRAMFSDPSATQHPKSSMKHVTKLWMAEYVASSGSCSSIVLSRFMASLTFGDSDSCAFAASATMCAMNPENRIAQLDAGLSPNIIA